MMEQLDDEGYTSPSKENDDDININLSTSSRRFYKNSKTDLHLELFEENHQPFTTCTSRTSLLPSFRVAWDEVAKLPPPTTNRHVSWDDMKYPFPFRNSNYNTTRRNRVNLNSRVFLSDHISTSHDIIDRIWMIPYENGLGHGDEQQRRQQLGNYEFPSSDHSLIHISPSSSSASSHVSSINFTPSVQNLMLNNVTTPTYLTMNQYIDHLLHLMCGRESQSFSLISASDQINGNGSGTTLNNSIEVLFRKNDHILIHGLTPITLTNFSLPFIECGSMYKRLINLVTTNDDVSCFKSLKESCRTIYLSSKKNAVFQSFISFIDHYLKLYQTVIMLKKDSILTMTQVHVFMKPLRSQLHVLEQIVDLQIEGNVVQLLTTLNNLLFAVENQIIIDLIRNLFISCASAYLRYISNWVFRGELGPPMEFHITKTSTTYNDRRFWTKQFIQNEMVPVFLKDSAEKIFETGKALSLLITLQPVLSPLRTSSLLADSFGEQIKAELGFEQLKNLSKNWMTKLDSFNAENSHLVSDIQESIVEVIYSVTKINEIDVAEIEQKRLNFHKKAEQLKADAFQRERDKKAALRLSLQAQIEQAKQSKIQKKLDERLEDRKNREWWAKQDRKNVAEGKSHAQKYFPRSSSDVDVCDSASQGENIPTTTTAMVQSKSEPVSIVDIFAAQPSTENNQNNVKILGSFFQQRQIQTQNPPIPEDPNSNSSIITSERQNLEESVQEVKFNPDKLITRSPEPYKLVPASEFSKSLIPLRSNLNNSHSLQKETKVKPDQFCMNEFLSHSVYIPLMVQNKMVNSVLLHHLIKEKMLFHHLAMINNFLCLQNGVFSHFLCELLINEVKKSSLRLPKDLHDKSYRINSILNEALSIALENEISDPLLKNLNFCLETTNSKKKSWDDFEFSSKAKSEYQILNSLRLTYIVEWPLNIILTDEMICHYENIFKFLMKLIRAELLLERMFLNVKSKYSNSAQLFQLNNFRFRMLHFVRSVRNYVNLTVIHPAWNELCSSFHNLDSMEKIYQHLVSYVKNISTNCLLGQKGEKLIKLILCQLIVVESFCSQLDSIINKKGEVIDWENGSKQIPKVEFHELVKKYEVSEQYAQLFTESVLKASTRRVYTKVDNFLEHYNFNGFFHVD